MDKKLFEIYATYAKDSGEELHSSWVAEDTPEERLKALEDECGWSDEWFDDPVDFEDGKIDTIRFSTYGDWDDPTGGWLQVQSYEEKREELADEYDKEVKRLKKLFGKEID